ncbi:ano10 [Symbiodinium sp. CCMP2456]|nr:ano10 [Symbiodinium sp. CCMP2456]
MSAYTKGEYEQLDAASGRGVDSPEVPMRRFYEVCMVFQHKTDKRFAFDEQENEFHRALPPASPEDHTKMQMWKQHRESILKTLQNCGLNLYCFYSRDRDQILVKIGAGAQKLRDTAARKRYKLQLKKEYLSAFAEFRHDHPGRPEFRFADRRIISHIYQTHTEDNLDGSGIFKTVDKIQLISHIIQSKDKDCAGINVAKLLHQKEVKAFFPLHEQSVMDKIKSLQFKWFWPDEEHANRLRDYFGDKITFYFLWMAFYVKWLSPLACLGLFLQFIDWCARTPDNVTAIPFCVLMSIWSLCLPHFWRRQEAKCAISWGSMDLVEQLEPHRPEHTGEQLINPVTSQAEPHYPLSKRIFNYLVSAAAMAVAACVCMLCILILLFIRHNIKNEVHHRIILFQFGIAAYVETTNFLLDVLATFLTNYENHRTQTEYETALLCKGMMLKFVNSFFALYYVAFFKEHQTLFSEPMECLRDQCFLDIQAQLGIFVLFRLFVSNVFEHFFPKIRLWFRSLSSYDKMTFENFYHGQVLELAEMSATEQQAKKEKHRNFDQFDEMLLTHGYATLFAVTSPWVCTATLLAVLVEIWVDMRSLLDSRQRPFPTQARNNEPWGTAFEIYGVMAALTNVLLLIFTSSQYSSWTITEKIVFFFFLEHLIFGARLFVQVIFPQVPQAVEVLSLKQDSVVHRCLEGIKVESNTDFSLFRESRVQEDVQVFGYDLLETDEADLTLSLRDSGKSMYQGVIDEVGTLRVNIGMPVSK